MKPSDVVDSDKARRDKRGILEMRPCQTKLSSESAIGSDQSFSLARLLQLSVELLLLQLTSFATESNFGPC